MRKSLLVCLLVIISITAVACGKKQEAVIIQAQDSGKDTTTGEIIKGDSAGTVDVDAESGKASNTQTSEENKHKEIKVSGEWECSNGSKMILDNGYNLIYSDAKDENLMGSYTANEKSLILSIWNRPVEVETTEYDADGNEIKGTKETFTRETIEYEVLAYEHNDDYTECKLTLKDANGNEVTATLVKQNTEESNTTQSYIKYQEYVDSVYDENMKKAAEEHGMTLEEYKEYKMQKQLEAEEKENNSTE